MRQDILVDLADAAKAAENSLTKAYALCKELCEQYFKFVGQQRGQAYAMEDAQQDFIMWEYSHYALYAHIVQDYILQAEAGIAGLSLMLHDCQKQHGENVWNRREYQPPDKKRA